MTDDQPQKTFSDMSAEDQAAFFATANEFLDQANDLVGIEPSDEIAAAFLYSCARFNAFTMQAMAGDPSAVDGGAVTYLADEFEKHVREHMDEDLSALSAKGESDPMRVVDLLMALDDRDEGGRSDFLDIADRFLDIANRLTRTERLGRISAAYMHACTRFNVYVMQGRGLTPEQADEAEIGRFRKAYEALLLVHLDETLVAPRA